MTTRTKSRRLILIVFALFFIPVLVAWILNITRPEWLPVGRTNHGELVTPPRQLETNGITLLNGDALNPNYFVDKWTFIHWTEGECDAECDAMLVETRQARLALGKDFERVQRVLLSNAQADPALTARLGEEHPGLLLAKAPSGWSTVIARDDGSTTRVSLVDPQGYFMLRYSIKETATLMLKDLKRLLKISKIG